MSGGPAAIFIAIALVRMVLRWGKQDKASAPAPYPTRAGYFAFTLLLLLPCTVGLLPLVLEVPWLAPFVLAGLLLSFPWLTARWLLIPLGRPRLAAWFSRLSAIGWGGDVAGGKALGAAWALLRAKDVTAADRAWSEKLLARPAAPPALRGAGVVALGLFAAGRGELDTARALCRSAFFMSKRVFPYRARRIAMGWLLADAAAHGRWSDALALGGLFPRHPLAPFFRAAALRLLQRQGAPGRPGLVLRWLWTGRWLATFPLLERAWHAAPGPEAARWTGEAGAEGTGPLRAALALHAALAQAPTEEQLQALEGAAAAWDAALSSEGVRAWADGRARELQPRGGGFGLDGVRGQVEAELAAWALERALPLGELEHRGELLEAIAGRARDEVLERVEASAAALSQRVASRQPLQRGDEWRAFVALQRQCELASAVGGEEGRRLAYEATHAPICNLGAWLFNERDERSLANGMFTWLLQEALRVGGDEEIHRYRKNRDHGP